MTATTTADRRRIIELKLWMEDHDITVKATSEYLGWAFATTRYNLMVPRNPNAEKSCWPLAFPPNCCRHPPRRGEGRGFRGYSTRIPPHQKRTPILYLTNLFFCPEPRNSFIAI